jgi:lipopolysaccharide/colanic/teichoic acid biosynthesis glycosyltransferase
MYYTVTKRFIDIVGATIGIIILSPIILLTAIAIKIDTPGPIIADTPKRVGQKGKLFKMYKFRSMVKNAIEILQKNPELMKQYKQNSYKLTHDPRVTKVGRFIRKTSMDELPQLINILRGEMSIVGPRAYYAFELEEQQKKYPKSKEYVKVILSAKPGLTGLWQVSGRSDVNFDKRVELDAQYVQRQSIPYDIYLILKTIPAVLFGKGAV